MMQLCYNSLVMTTFTPRYLLLIAAFTATVTRVYITEAAA